MVQVASHQISQICIRFHMGAAKDGGPGGFIIVVTVCSMTCRVRAMAQSFNNVTTSTYSDADLLA